MYLFVLSLIPNKIPLTTIVTHLQNSYRSRISNHWTTIPSCSVVPPIYSPRNHTVTYHCSDLQVSLHQIKSHIFKNVTEAEFQTIGPLYLHVVWYLPFTKSPRKHTVTYHFIGLQEVYSGNCQIHTKCQLQYLHPPQISTRGKCHCAIIHQRTKDTEHIESMSKYLHK